MKEATPFIVLITGFLIFMGAIFYLAVNPADDKPCTSHQEQYSTYNATTGEFKATTDTTYTGDCRIGVTN